MPKTCDEVVAVEFYHVFVHLFTLADCFFCYDSAFLKGCVTSVNNEHDSQLIINNQRYFINELDKLELQMYEKANESIKKEYEWLKWLVAISAGVFSVMTTQLAKGNFQLDQLFLIKLAILFNALGVIFGVIYLYQDVKTDRDFVNKLHIQALNLMLKGERRYERVIASEKSFLSNISRTIFLLSLFLSISVWICFIWRL